MAAGTYTTDLTLINLAETNTDWNDINQAGGGGANEAAGDFAIQGNNAISRQVSNTRRGVLYDFGSTITLGADDHIYTWVVSATPGITDIKSAGGIRVSIGTSIAGAGAWYDFYVNGSDTLPGGSMKNYAVYFAAASASNTQGSPGANPRYFGAQIVTTGTAKDINFGCDAIRYGTGYYITDGDATTPITFDSASQDNDLNANRYGLFTAIPGGYEQKGRFAVGQNNTGTPTQAYFDDSNTSVIFADTEYAKSNFTQIIVDHPSTFFSLQNTNITGIGTQNPGQINFLDSSTTGKLIGNLIKTIGTTQLQAAVTASSTWLQCSTVDQSGSLITNARFTDTSAPSSSLTSDRPDRISSTAFAGNTTLNVKHGIEIIVTGSYVFSANTFTNYVSGSSSGSALLFNPPGGTGDLTLNVVDGGNAPSFTNLSTGTVTINENVSVSLTNMNPFTEVRVYRAGTNPPEEIAGIENIQTGTPVSSSFTFSDQAGNSVDIAIHNLQYEHIRLANFTIPSSNTTVPISQQLDRSYSNPV
jgi:hypothetical protein